MAIHKVIFDKSTGDFSKKSGATRVENSFEETYLVITDTTDTPKTIYKEASVNGLPVVGDTLKYGKNSPVKSISITKRSDTTVSAVPSRNVAYSASGYYVWNYAVTYAGYEGSGSGSDSVSDGIIPNKAYNITFMRKTYDEYGCTVYQQIKEYKSVRDALNKLEKNWDTRIIATNALGDPIFYNSEKSNFVLSFDFYRVLGYTSRLRSYINTMNARDITVAGEVIEARLGYLSNITESTETQDGVDWTRVHVEIEIVNEKLVGGVEIVPTSYYARYAPGTEALRIQQVNPSFYSLVRDKGETDGVYWFDKERGYGNFNGCKNIKDDEGNPFTRGVHYEDVTEAKVLKLDGTFYKSKNLDMSDKDLEKYFLFNGRLVDWSGAELPRT